MSDKPFPARCSACRWSKPEDRSSWNNECWHPEVVSRDAWALANNREGQPRGSNCADERRRTSPFAPCGQKGKLWEAK